MSFILKMMVAPGGPWMLLAAVIVLFAAGTASGYVVRGVIDAPALSDQKTKTAEADGRTQTCIATHEKGRADGAEQVIKALSDAAGDVAKATAELDARARVRDTATQKFLKDLANAPNTSVCGTSPAELAFRRSVFDGPAVPAAP